MDKAINLQAKLHVGNDPQAAAKLQQSLPAHFAADNPGLALTVKHISPPDAEGDVTVKIYIEGDQDPAADFAALTRGALHKTVASMNAASGTGAGSSAHPVVSSGATPHTGVHIKDLQETEGDDENTGVTLAPWLRAQEASSAPPAAPPSAPPASTVGQSPPAPAPAPQAQQTASTPGKSQWWAFWKRGK